MLRIGFQQCELLISTGTNLSGQRMIVAPEIRISAVDHVISDLE